ncbi:Regulatory protein LEU3 [Lachnellula suecica]|uniref:Regulatory protein LEU3 n=1 Tax=Lachnellula suecica TaxID=602035 RepID=A0A8T9BW14_9HELO|nr:Regulatory protein LEU3 [Lachnellula suecica]
MASSARTSVDNSDGSPARQTRITRAKQVVCTACRQSKVRCVSNGFGECSRCSRIGLECKRDTEYKRQSKSRKIAELETQVQLLASAFNESNAVTKNNRPVPEISTPPPNLEQGPTNLDLNTRKFHPAINATFNGLVPAPCLSSWSESQIRPAVNGPSNGTQPFVSLTEEGPSLSGGLRPLAKESRSIKSVHLTTSQIDHLFEVFFEHYHPSLPFLDPSKSPDDYYDSGESIFWTIISIASRRYQDDFMLFIVLSEWVPKLVWSLITTPVYNLALVQSIILISIWPFPTDSTYKDTLITLSSIALSAAMQIGLHRPMNTSDFQRRLTQWKKTSIDEKECKERTATWAAANIVSQTVNSTYGLLPTTPFDKTIEFACQAGNIYTLPDSLRFKLILQRYCDRVTKVIYSDLRESFDSSHPNDKPGFILTWESNLNALDFELNEIEKEHSASFSVHDTIYLACARLYIHTMYFFDSSCTPTRKAGVLRAYASALSLITTLFSADATTSLFSHISAYHMRMFLTATCLVLKVLRSSYRQDVDFEEGKGLFDRATLAAGRCSIASGDTAGKITRLMAQVWHSGNEEALNEPPELLVKSRLGASIIYDFIWTWKQECGGLEERHPLSKPIPPSSPSEEENMMFQPLDVFQDASFVDLEFLNDPNWMDGFGNPVA